MLTPKQAQNLSGTRKAATKSRCFSEGENENLGLRYAQVGMPFVSEHSVYLTVHLKNDDSLSLAEMKKLACKLHRDAEDEGFTWVAVIGVGLDLWSKWCNENSAPLDEEL